MRRHALHLVKTETDGRIHLQISQELSEKQFWKSLPPKYQDIYNDFSRCQIRLEEWITVCLISVGKSIDDRKAGWRSILLRRQEAMLGGATWRYQTKNWEVRVVMEEQGLMCHVMQREVIMSLVLLFHLPHPSLQFHSISAICCSDCFSSTVPVTNWLAALPLPSGLSLWMSMCSSSASLFLPIVFFLIFFFFHHSRLFPNPLNQPGVKWRSRGDVGAFADQLMTFSKGQKNRDYSSGSWWDSSSSSSGWIMPALWRLGWGAINVEWWQDVTGWQHSDITGSNTTLPLKTALPSFKSQ